MFYNTRHYLKGALYMIYSHYIITDELKKEIEDVVKFGKAHFGVITQSQLSMFVQREKYLERKYKA